MTRLQAFLRSEIDWKEDGEDQGYSKRFEQGVLPEALRSLMEEALPQVQRVEGPLRKIDGSGEEPL